MIEKHFFTWRKGFILSATFLLLALVSVSCKKKENELGLNTVQQGNELSSDGIDTFSLITYTFKEDSTITKNNVVSLLGSYNDPTFGMVNGEIYTELHLQSLAPNFGDLSTIAIDSFVLGLVYSGHYGKVGDQTIEVFEIDEMNGIEEDSTYYAFSSISSDPTDWVMTGYNVLNMNPDNLTIIGENDVPSQLRIHLDTNRARTILVDSENLPGSFDTNENFSDYFKGLHIRTSNGTQASGDGGVFYFNLTGSSSKLTIYYTQDGEAKTYDFFINGDTDYFNHVDMINTGTPVQTVIDMPTFGQTEYYAQAFKTRAAIEMPGVVNIPSTAVVHSAVMQLPIQHQTGVEYEPAGAISVLRENPDEPGTYIALGNAIYSSFSKQYSFDLRFHIQRVINGEIENTPLIVAPLFYNSSADRIIFNGPDSQNKMKPRLRILYTEF